MFKRILVAFDGSKHANRAAHVALDLAAKYSARVTFLIVDYVHAPSVGGPSEAASGVDASSAIKKVLNIARGKGLQDEDFKVVVEVGLVAQTIANYAAYRDYDVIVMGRRGLGKVKGLLLGSVSTKVLSLAKCTVIAVR